MTGLAPSPAPAPSPLSATLRDARRARRMSQLALALRLDVSQRHVSFVESGRARPSRDLLAAWLAELEAPLPVRNEAMLQAGFAPMYGETPLGAPTLVRADEALQQLVQAHDPMPAFVLDAEWNVQRMNRGARWLASALLPWAPPLDERMAVNMLDLLAHPEGLLASITNIAEVAPAFLAQLQHEGAALPALAPRIAAVRARIDARVAPRRVAPSAARPSAPMLVTRYATAFGGLAFFSMFTTFGTPQDITLASLRVEHLFAADEGTRAVMEREVGRAK